MASVMKAKSWRQSDSTSRRQSIRLIDDSAIPAESSFFLSFYGLPRIMKKASMLVSIHPKKGQMP